MSHATVRAAVTAFFQPPAVPGLNAMFRAQPIIAGPDRLGLSTGGGTGTPGFGAYGFVHLNESDESRVTVPYATGSKAVRYVVGLIVIYQWLTVQNTSGVQEVDAWVGPLDDLIGGIKDRLRSDPTLGNSDVVFEAGQADNDIRISQDLPRIDGGVLHSWNLLEFDLTEIVEA